MEDYFGWDILFARHCGISALGCEGGRTRLRLALSPTSTNQFGVFDAGAHLAPLDVAIGSAARVKARSWLMAVDRQVR